MTSASHSETINDIGEKCFSPGPHLQILLTKDLCVCGRPERCSCHRHHVSHPVAKLHQMSFVRSHDVVSFV